MLYEPWQQPLFQEIHTPRGIEYKPGFTIKAAWYVIPIRDEGWIRWNEYYKPQKHRNLGVWRFDHREKVPGPPPYQPDENGTCQCERCKEHRERRCPCCGM